MLEINLFSRKDLTKAPAPNFWDIIAFAFIAGCIFSLAWLVQQMVAPFDLAEPINIDLRPGVLPEYCLRSVGRICLALFFSFLFTFVVGTTAAKSKLAERIIIPAIDILQSVPVLGFLSVGVWGFLLLFPGSWLGPECAAIFAIFTAQVWNMTLSFYQSLCMVPKSLKESTRILHLSPWQRFWRLEVPYAMPGLLWNCMLSISASWFFMVASEAIEVNNHTILLPGIGSYIAFAIKNADMDAVCWAIFAMFTTIIIYDQIFFRPIMQWGEKFRTTSNSEEIQTSSFITKILTRTRLVQMFFGLMAKTVSFLIMQFPAKIPVRIKKTHPARRYNLVVCLYWASIAAFIACFIWFGYLLLDFFHTQVSLADLLDVLGLGFISTLRILILVMICLIVWVPIGVWIGLRPRLATKIQPILQILSAFPANLLFPFFASLIIKYNLNTNIWLSPLMILGTQWYVLFNVIAGTMLIPIEQKYAVASLGVGRMLWWRKFILPGIGPHLITGAITATGGAWNASIIAEAINWGNTELYATGLGAYITYHTKVGNSVEVALGIVVMCFYVVIINRILWQPLYNFAQTRLQS